ncbi:MAG: hypothetical protein ACE144_04995 [Thermodesulfobacteriota bacterium]
MLISFDNEVGLNRRGAFENTVVWRISEKMKMGLILTPPSPKLRRVNLPYFFLLIQTSNLI